MHMADIDTVRGWQGATLVGSDGDKIGSIDSIYLDDQTGEPEWALVNTGFFGTKSSFVPLAQASASGDQVQVPYDKQLVKDAPRDRSRPAPGRGRIAAAVALLRPRLPGRRHRHRPGWRL